MSDQQTEAAEGSESDTNVLLCAAKAIKLPDWATHVAVSTVRDNDAEPCAWLEEAEDYIDEDPNNFENPLWAASYKHAYWKFFSREELGT